MRRLLVVTLLAVIGAGSAITAALSYRDSLIETDELFDAKLAHSARVLMSLVDEPLGDAARQPAAEPLVIKVWHGDGPGQGHMLISPDGQTIVSSGNQLPVCLKAFSPANTSFHSITRWPPYALPTASSTMRWQTGVISAPTPSPSIKGMTTLSGTRRVPFCFVILFIILFFIFTNDDLTALFPRQVREQDSFNSPINQ